jgi:hypothetical protein
MPHTQRCHIPVEPGPLGQQLPLFADHRASPLLLYYLLSTPEGGHKLLFD